VHLQGREKNLGGIIYRGKIQIFENIFDEWGRFGGLEWLI